MSIHMTYACVWKHSPIFSYPVSSSPSFSNYSVINLKVSLAVLWKCFRMTNMPLKILCVCMYVCVCVWEREHMVCLSVCLIVWVLFTFSILKQTLYRVHQGLSSSQENKCIMVAYVLYENGMHSRYLHHFICCNFPLHSSNLRSIVTIILARAFFVFFPTQPHILPWKALYQCPKCGPGVSVLLEN